MSLFPPEKSRTIRAVRRRAEPRPVPDTKPEAQTEPELSNYELIERRSHELEVERASGGSGTSQPPDAETPLLFPRNSNRKTRTETAGDTHTRTTDRIRSRN